MQKIKLETERFILKTLTLEDANTTYLNWLADKIAQRYIVTAKECTDLHVLKKYIAEKIDKKDCLFLGIFNKENMNHIGNLKYEPIDFEAKTAVLGILIGDVSWRGKSVAKEVIESSVKFLKLSYGIRDVILGVEMQNESALKSYKKIGFIPYSDDNFISTDKSIFMKLSL